MIFCLKGSTCQSVEKKKLGVKNLLLFARLFAAAGQIKKSRQKTTLQKQDEKSKKKYNE